MRDLKKRSSDLEHWRLLIIWKQMDSKWHLSCSKLSIRNWKEECITSLKRFNMQYKCQTSHVTSIIISQHTKCNSFWSTLQNNVFFIFYFTAPSNNKFQYMTFKKCHWYWTETVHISGSKCIYNYDPIFLSLVFFVSKFCKCHKKWESKVKEV